MARCSVCARFASFMETDDYSAAAQRPARVQPEADDGVHVPPSCSHAEEPAFIRGDYEMDVAAYYSPLQAPVLPAARPVSISLPASPTRFDIARSGVELQQYAAITGASRIPPPRPPAATATAQPDRVVFRSLPMPPATATAQPDRVVFRSQPMPAATATAQPDRVVFRSQPMPPAAPPMAEKDCALLPPRIGRMIKARRDKSYDSFKTWSGKLEEQIATHLLGSRPQQQEAEKEETEVENATSNHVTARSSMPKVQRFFAALEGPELDKLRSSEELILPSDKTWPFLLRFPVSAFGMVLGMSSQAILWKRVAISASTRFLHITVKINLVLWCISVALMCVVSALYGCKLVFFFEAVRREYYHPIRANFFFAPWIACLFLAIGVPEAVAETLPHWLCYLLMAPILCLQLKIYGQWISGGQRRLSRVANPSNHLSIVGNFVGALLGGIMGLKEGPLFFFAVGLAHYVVLFVTLYQRLPTSETLPRDLHPVFFLFVATPSVACLAWARITGEFDYGSRIAYFIAMFLYASLAVRINLFRGFRFSLAWWAYTFPMTSAAIASIRYSSEVKNVFTQSLCIGLSVAATLTVTALFFTTLLHAVVLRDLFPNDISIAITDRRFKPTETMMTVPPAERGRSSKARAPAGPSDPRDLEAAVATSYT